MTHPGWPLRLAREIASQVRRYRKDRGLTAQQLADRCTSLGADISRSTIADLENGRRVMITVADLLVLAAALKVPPIELAIPLARQETAEILPGVELPTWDAARWFRGDGDLVDLGGGLAYAPADYHEESCPECGQSLAIPGKRQTLPECPVCGGEALRDLPIDWLMGHQSLVDGCLSGMAVVRGLTETLQLPGIPATVSEETLRGAERAETNLRREERELARHRRTMRAKGFAVPPLPPELRHVDQIRAG